MTDACRALPAAAVQAPSGDNTQPWRFVVEGEGRLLLLPDETRDRSPMNSGQRMTRIAVGAALENLLRVAKRSGWTVELTGATDPALATLRVLRADGLPSADPAVAGRVTNRKPYDGRPVPADLLETLAAETPLLDGVRTHWVVGK